MSCTFEVLCDCFSKIVLTGICGMNSRMPVIATYQHQEPGEYTIMLYINFDFMHCTLYENFKECVIQCGTSFRISTPVNQFKNLSSLL